MPDFTDLIASEGVVLLPGAIKGLLRDGSPIVCTSGVYAGHYGVVLDIMYGASDAIVAFRGSREPFVATVEVAHLSLTLNDEGGRQRAAVWAASKFDMSYGSHNNMVYSVWLWNLGNGQWSLRSPECMHNKYATFRAPGSPEPSTSRPEIASLGELDPNDPRKLADMSRWVDAEALRRICLYTASELAR